MLQDGNSVKQADRSGEQPDLFVKKKSIKIFKTDILLNVFFKIICPIIILFDYICKKKL